jgi:protein-serine/threonine kinase
MIKELGQGATSQVFQVLSKTSEVFALKVLKSSIDFKFIQEEYVASIQVASPNIIRSYSLYQFKKNYSILLEYCDFTLFSLLPELKGRGENVLAFILREVLKGLIALHQKYIIHRDIKCENIFVNRDGEVKLGDFGMAAQLVRERDSRLTSAGTPYWEAPEVLSGKSYTTSCDIWSFGITSFELATGSPPHSNCLTILSLITKLKSEDPPRLPEDFSPSFSQFIESCLQKDPENRKQASVLLLSPFLLNIDEINAKNDLLSVISSHQSRPLKP